MVEEARSREESSSNGVMPAAADAEAQHKGKSAHAPALHPKALDPRTAFLFPGRAEHEEGGISLKCFLGIVGDMLSGLTLLQACSALRAQAICCAQLSLVLQLCCASNQPARPGACNVIHQLLRNSSGGVDAC